MNGLADFVSGGYPLPWNPVTLGEFVPGGFPLPQSPVYYTSSRGSLPKAPSIPRALIGSGNGADLESDGCGGLGNCGCSSCGMGALTSDTFIPQAKLPTFLRGDAYISGVPTVYLALGVVAVGFMFMGGSARRGRR